MDIDLKTQSEINRINTIDCSFLRDLVAFLYSPFVFESYFDEQLHFELPEVSSFDELWKWYELIKENAIPQNLEKLRLGQYAEVLLLFYFKNSRKYDVLESNLQLIEEKITIGEIDYLIATSSEKIHLELAIKFYLKYQIEDQVEWIGPSAKDKLSRKQNKLISHQLPIAEKHKNLLPNYLKSYSFSPKLLLRGAQFVPYNEYLITEKSRKNSWWIHFNEFEKVMKDQFFYQVISKRRDWIFPFNNRIPSIDSSTLDERIKLELENKNEVLVCRLDHKKNPIDKGFVVRDQWPN